MVIYKYERRESPTFWQPEPGAGGESVDEIIVFVGMLHNQYNSGSSTVESYFSVKVEL